MLKTSYTIIEKEGNLYVALCPELDVASQGATMGEATANLKEAVELFLERADPDEIKQRPQRLPVPDRTPLTGTPALVSFRVFCCDSKLS